MVIPSVRDVVVRGDRVELRELRAADADQVAAFFLDPEIARWSPSERTTERDLREYLERVAANAAAEERSHYELAVVVEGRVAGDVGMRIEHPLMRAADVGYEVARDLWGKGIATEAVGLLIGFGFDQLGLHRIAASCDPDNPASRRVLEKVGMSYEGRLRSVLRLGGEWRDVLQHSILEHEWRAGPRATR